MGSVRSVGGLGKNIHSHNYGCRTTNFQSQENIHKQLIFDQKINYTSGGKEGVGSRGK